MFFGGVKDNRIDLFLIQCANMKSFKYKWDLTLLYKSVDDPQIEKDLKIGEKEYDLFVKKYKDNKSYLKDTRILLEACKEYEKLMCSKLSNPLIYFWDLKDLDADNKDAQAKVSKYSQRIQEITNKILFFKLELGKLPEGFRQKILKDKQLSHYHYFLELIFDEAKYQLSEKEEQLMSLMLEPAKNMWTRGFSKVLSNQVIRFEGKDVSVGEIASKINQLPTKRRRELHNLFMEKLKEISDFAETELNAICVSKKISDELRGLKKPYSSTLLDYQNDEKTIENMIDVVTKYFKISKKFYEIKAKLLKEKKLSYADRAANVGRGAGKYTFDQVVDILSTSFGKIDVKYKNIFEQFLAEGKIDVFPKKGKKGGAYCRSSIGIPTMVLLNHTDSFNSLITTAHEMGHAFHSELSKKQSPVYENYTISVAEVASTFFENFVFDEVFNTLDKKEKIIALHDKINGSVSTIFRQVACFNFENELHMAVRNKGYVSKEEIVKMMNKHMQTYLGPLFDLTENDGYFFVEWRHLRYYFYVYAYAFGEIISSALYEKYKKDKTFLLKIEQFLSAGGSKSPYQIFKDIGIDISDPDFFVLGLKKIEKEVKLLEQLID